MNSESSSRIKFAYGREHELSSILDSLQTKKSVTLVSGESGIGKSIFLDTCIMRIQSIPNLVGAYYDQYTALVSELDDYSYPAKILLKRLVQNIKEAGWLEKEQPSRLKKNVLTYLTEEKQQIAKSIFDQIFVSLKLEKSTPIFRDLVSIFRNKNLSLERAREFIKQKESILEIFVRIFISIGNEFPDKKFVLVIDRLERTGKSSIDFLINLIKFLPNNFHVVLSYEVGAWEDEGQKKIYADTKNNVINDLGGKELLLEGIDESAIGKWIYDVRGKNLPLVPDLKRIRNNSAGIPIVIEEWLRTSVDLNIDEIDRSKFCDKITQALDKLSNSAFTNLRKLAILQSIFGESKKMKYLELESLDQVSILDRELINNGIFDKTKKWFRHELVRKCLQDSLSDEMKKNYNNSASNFYTSEIAKLSLVAGGSENPFALYLAQAYHIHQAGNFSESFNKNVLIGDFATKLGDFDLAEKSYRMAIEAATQTKNIEGKMMVQNNLAASVFRVWGRWEKALTIFQELKQYYISTHNDKNLSVVLLNIGNIHQVKGEPKEALKRLKEALEIARRVKDGEILTNILNNIAMIHSGRADYTEAMKWYDEALEIPTDNEMDKAPILNNIAIIWMDRGKPKEALEYYQKSLQITTRSGDQLGISLLLGNIGEIYLKIKDLDNALKIYQKSLAIDRNMGNLHGVASNLSNIGVVYVDVGRETDAKLNYEEALSIARTTGDRELIARILNNLGIIYKKQGKLDQAINSYRESLEIKYQLNDVVGILKSLVNLGNLESKQQRYIDAMRNYMQALELAKRIGNEEYIQLITKIIASHRNA